MTFRQIIFYKVLQSSQGKSNITRNYIENHPDYELRGIFADEGISGTNTKKREQFNKLLRIAKRETSI